MLAAKILRPKVLIAFCLSLTLALLVATMLFNILYGFNLGLKLTLSGTEEDGIILMQEGARSVYTSSIPQSLAKNLELLGVKVKSYTLTLTSINEQPVVVRGVEDFNDYISVMIIGKIPKDSTNFAIVGEKASKILKIKNGDLIIASNPTNPAIIIAKVYGIYRLSDLRDYEIVIPIALGKELANKPKNFVSMIVVKGIQKQELYQLLKKEYSLEIVHPFSSGEFVVLNIDKVPIANAKIKGKDKIRFELPFGKYSIVYKNSHYVSTLSTFLLKENKVINLTGINETVSLKLVAPSNAKIQLKDAKGKEIFGRQYDGLWIYKVKPGSYIVNINGSTYNILVTGDTEFNPLKTYLNRRNVSIKVIWYDGIPVSNYIMVVKDSNGRIVYSANVKKDMVEISLPNEELEVEVYKPPYVAKSVLLSNASSLIIRLPAVANPEKVPLATLTKVKALSNLEVSSMTLSAFLGISLNALTTLLLSLSAISILAVVSVQRYLQVSSSDNISVLYTLGARKIDVIRIIGPLTLLLSILCAFLASILSIYLHNLLIQVANLTIFGYGLPINYLYSLLFSIVLVIASWVTWIPHIGRMADIGK